LIVNLSDGTHRSIPVDKATTARDVIKKIVERLSAGVEAGDFQLYVQFKFGYGRLLNDENVLSELTDDWGPITRVSLWNRERKKTKTMSSEGLLSHSLSTWSLDELSYRESSSAKEGLATTRRNTVDFDNMVSITDQQVVSHPDPLANGMVSQSTPPDTSPQKLKQRRSTLYRNSAIRRARETSPITPRANNGSHVSNNPTFSSTRSANINIPYRRKPSLRKQALVLQGSAPQNISHSVIIGHNDEFTGNGWPMAQSVPNSPMRRHPNDHLSTAYLHTSSKPDIHSDNYTTLQSLSGSHSNLDSPVLQRSADGIIRNASYDTTRKQLREAMLQSSRHPPQDKKEDYFDRLNPQYDTLSLNFEDGFDQLELSLPNENGVTYNHFGDQTQPSLSHSRSLVTITDKMRLADHHFYGGTPPAKPARVMSHMYYTPNSGPSSRTPPPKPSRGPTPQHIKLTIERWNKQSLPQTVSNLQRITPYATLGGHLSNNSNNNNSDSSINESCTSSTSSIDGEIELNKSPISQSSTEPPHPSTSSNPRKLLGLRLLLTIDSPLSQLDDNISVKDYDQGEESIVSCDTSAEYTELDCTNLDTPPASGTNRSPGPSTPCGLMSRISHTTIAPGVYQKQFTLSKGQRLKKRTSNPPHNETHFQISSEEVHLLCAHALGHLFEGDRKFGSVRQKGGGMSSKLSTGPPDVPPRSYSLNDTLSVIESKQLMVDLYKSGSLQDYEAKYIEDKELKRSVYGSPMNLLPLQHSTPTITVTDYSSHSSPPTSQVPLVPPKKRNIGMYLSGQRSSVLRDRVSPNHATNLLSASPQSTSIKNSTDLDNFLGRDYQCAQARKRNEYCANGNRGSSHSLQAQYHSSLSLSRPNNGVGLSKSLGLRVNACHLSPEEPLFESHSSPSILPCSEDVGSMTFFSSKEAFTPGRRGVQCAWGKNTVSTLKDKMAVSLEEDRMSTSSQFSRLSKLSQSLRPFHRSHFVDSSGQYNYIVWYKGDQYDRVWRSGTRDFCTVLV
jgi:hypothetical protein